MADIRMLSRIIKLTFIFCYIAVHTTSNVFAQNLENKFCLSPKTVLDMHVDEYESEQIESVLKIIYPHFESKYKYRAISFFKPILRKNSTRLLLHHLFRQSSDGFDNVSPYTHWDADGKSVFPSTVDKTQWLVMSSDEPFSYTETRYNDGGIDTNLFAESIKLGDKYFAFLAPVHNGGKKKVVLEREGEEQEVHYFKRENIKTHRKYTFALLKRFRQYLQSNTSNMLTNKMSKFLIEKLGENKMTELFSDFDIDTRGNYVKVEDNKQTIFPVKNIMNYDNQYISIPFKLINAFKRGRINLSDHKFMNLMLLDIAEHFGVVDEMLKTLDADEMELLSNAKLFRKRLHAADLKNESDVRLLQLNSRVKGQRPKDITDKQIEEWKNAGINMLYFMGVWETSPFSKEYNRFWGSKDKNSTQEREASAFAIKNYHINPEVATSAEFNRLRNKLKQAGIKVMLDFVPNHMAMDNDFLPEHPEYFMHDTLPNDHYIDSNDYDSFDPTNWEKHSNGNIKYRLWYSKDFDEHWGSDHFLLQELDVAGNQVKATKFYHGNWSWRDTVQVDYQNPKAREFMRKNAVKAAYRAGGGGLRWDFVHVVLQKHFNASWDRKDFKDFLRKWKGVENIPEKNEAHWDELFQSFISNNKYIPRKIPDEKSRDVLEEVIDSFKDYLKNTFNEDYNSLAPAFHFEGLGQVIRSYIYPTFDDESYREIFDSVPSLRFHETIERTVNQLKSVFPDIINIAEAYEEEAYIHNLGIDAIYAANMHKVLVDNMKEGRSFFDSAHDFFNIVRENSHIWDMKNHVFYMQNFDEIPAIHTLSPEDIMFKSGLLYGLPGVKYFEWGLLEGNTNRLGADWIHPEVHPLLAQKFKPFFTELINVSADDIITHGSLHQMDLADNVRGYKRKYLGESISIVANILDEVKKIPVSIAIKEPHTTLFKLLDTSGKSYIKDGFIYLAPKSVIWLKSQKTNSLSIHELADKAA